MENFKTIRKDKTVVINDPLGLIHSLASSESLYYHLKLVLSCYFLKSGDERTDVQMEVLTSLKIVITTGHDCGSALWIKKWPKCLQYKKQSASRLP